MLAADGSAGASWTTCRRPGSLGRPTAWLFGNEAWGLPADVLELADEAVAVPIYGRAESLNLAAAAAVCLYASARAQAPPLARTRSGGRRLTCPGGWFPERLRAGGLGLPAVLRRR